MKRYVKSLSVCFLLVLGCSTSQKDISFETEVDDVGKNSQGISPTVKQGYKEALDICREAISGLQKKSQEQSTFTFWLKFSGLIAGSVVAPVLLAQSAANAATAAAFSGWAGATNLASSNLTSSGMDGTSSSQVANGIVDNLNRRITIIVSSSASNKDKLLAIEGMKADCTIYKLIDSTQKPSS